MKVMIPLQGNDIAPRFDLATEVIVATVREEKGVGAERILVLPSASAQAVCHTVVTEEVDAVVCCAIEDEYYQYLLWKRITVMDSVMGPYRMALQRLAEGVLAAGDNLIEGC